MMHTVKLNNGIEMPIEGYGVFQVSPEETERCVTEALEVGYRSIDTAAAYGNEEAVGKAIKLSGIPREELFVTTKLWVSDQGYENTKLAFETSLKKLGLDYLDLYLIHQPFGDYYGSWRAMEDLYKEGKIKAIGVSNFEADRLVDLILNNDVVPAVNQIEVHPFLQQNEAKAVMEEYGVQIEAWGPLSEGANNIFENELLKEIAEKHQKSVAQVILRWHLDRGVIIIPKSVRKERMQENLAVFDFSLGQEDIEKIATLDLGKSTIIDHHNVEVVKQLNSLNTPH
ncbi:diketogulonate reductase-like aldo/keto reductase [Alkalibacterium olivapovliticus]|uniref:Diketogulonate reductase-like aldo/keto reductase n=2 Tax=Alkalibacterium olivapovliticus TaxID=99907 RepID=A0A2T0VWX8_9LACT|nr:diketogulonate reductase-like aldo/keto reductase [Alkalibacterium olivapovliticus]